MNELVQNFDISKHFWKEFPQLIPAFREFYTNDKSWGKKYTSSVMWALVMVYHPKSDYYNLPLEDKQAIAIQELELDTETKKFKFEKHQDVIDRFKAMCLSKAQKFLLHWEQEMEDRMKFLESIKYSHDTPMDLLDLKESWMKQSHNMWKQLMACKKDVEEEEARSRGRGGSIESLSEQGKI